MAKVPDGPLKLGIAQNSKSRYRPEIDGLRAFAVVAVIINHFNKDLLPSGYLGVDIFFVISGYVITSSLTGRKSENLLDFLTGFYERRIKRLVPALVVFVLITSVLISLFNPDPGAALGLGWRSLFGISNINLYRSSTDYFAQSTELNPFTHTWSLGVEEQFYLLFPFLIWFSGFGQQTAKGARNLFFWVGALTIASLIGFIYLYQLNQPAAYFLMPLRFWEMAAGCLVFIGFQKRARIEQALEKVPPLLVIAAMVGVMYLPVSAAVPATILTVVLSAVLIACLKKGTAAYDFFTLEKIIYVGLISYSLYLWHWSVLSISRWTIGVHWWSVPIQVGLMLLLAIGSYRWIETPLRKENWFRIRWNNLVAGGSALGIAFASIVLLIKPLGSALYSGAKSEDFSDAIAKPIDFAGSWTGRVAKNCNSSDNSENDALNGLDKITREFIETCLSASSDKPLIAFSGDSHSLSIFPIGEKISAVTRYDVFSHSRDGCAFPPQGKTSRENCFEVQSSVINEVIKEIRGRRSKGSIMVATSYLNSHFGYDGAHSKQFKENSDGSRQSIDNNLSKFISASEELARRLKRENASLVIFAPLPQHPGFTPEICSPQWFRRFPSGSCVQTPRKFLEVQRSHIMKALTDASSRVSNIYIFDPFDRFCDEAYCYVLNGKSFMFSDDNHLSKEGAIMIYDDFMRLVKKIESSQESKS